MKIWLKLFLGAILGIIFGALLPPGGFLQDLFAFLSEIFVSIGRFILYPLVFCSIAIGAYELKRDKQTLKVILRGGST